MELIKVIFQFLDPRSSSIEVDALEAGLIHQTLMVKQGPKKYILQKMNGNVFKNIFEIGNNHLKIIRMLKKSNYSRKLAEPQFTIDCNYFYENKKDEFWRMQSYVKGTESFPKVQNTKMAKEAAECFSEFYKYLNEKPVVLEVVLADFINFEKRISDFKQALSNASESRLKEAENEIKFITENLDLPNLWIDLEKKRALPKRVIHADPKISNVLFDKKQKAVSIIDLDTLMNGTLLYDFGDMIRSYTNITEEDDSFNENNFSKEIYAAVKEGFLIHLWDLLTPIEFENLDYAAKVVIYIQAMRFLTDYLNNDVYYKVNRENQNLDRAKNQINLLKNLMKEIS